jgi:hypothetical protein
VGVSTPLPDAVRPLAQAFHAELGSTLGDRYLGLFLYGSACFPPSAVADFDAHVLVGTPFDDADRMAVDALHERLKPLPLGDEMDVWYVTLASARSSDPPQTERRPGFRDGAWAIHRAHVHAGRFCHVHGPDPREIVPVPTWDELDTSLQDAIDWMDENALVDAKAYCVLQLCRVLYSYETRDVVVSKLQAGIWALAALDVEHHALIRTAIDAYERCTYVVDEDIHAFDAQMRGRIESARRRSG